MPRTKWATMAANPCRTKELDAALDAARLAWDRHLLARQELQAQVATLRRGLGRGDLERSARVDEFVERFGQLTGAVDAGVKVGAAVDAFSAAAALVIDPGPGEVESGGIPSPQVAKLTILVRRVESTARAFAHRREQSRPLFERYWECTERLRPRRVELRIETDGAMSAGLATARLRRTWTARAMLTAQSASGSTSFSARFARWLTDPSLPQQLSGSGVVTSTMPTYDWTQSRTDIQVTAAKPVTSGGPLRAQFQVFWHRGDPGYASVTVTSSGEQTVTLRVQLTVQALTSRLGGEHALHELLRQQLLSHKIGAKSVAAQWDPVQLRHAYESRRSTASEQSHCRVWLHPSAR